jgi:hypothetical protein
VQIERGAYQYSLATGFLATMGDGFADAPIVKMFAKERFVSHRPDEF